MVREVIGHAALSSSATPEHFTPAHWIGLVREVMGGIDCDPASCAEANETVKAKVYYDRESGGLRQPWSGRCYINPPGSCHVNGVLTDCAGMIKRGGKMVPKRSCTCQLPQLFWQRLNGQWFLENTREFVWACFNIAQLRTMQKYDHEMLLDECDVFVPDKRIRWTGGSPTKDNAFLYAGPNRKQFRATFGRESGQLWHARYA